MAPKSRRRLFPHLAVAAAAAAAAGLAIIGVVGAPRGSTDGSAVSAASSPSSNLRAAGHAPSPTIVPIRATPPAGLPPFAPGEVLVKFRAGTKAADKEAARAAMVAVSAGSGATPGGPTAGSAAPGAVKRWTFHSGAEHWRLPPGLSTEQAVARLAARADVEYAEPNYRVMADRLPDDPRLAEQYALHNTGQTGGVAGADIDALRAWNVATGDRVVVVGIIDSGIDAAHPDLAANLYTNPGEIPDNGLDDDGNGFVDDVHGWDFANDDNDPFDDAGHGTHVAGILGAATDNGTGVAGINWRVSILPMKFLGQDGSGYTADAVRAIDYSTIMGARVLNNSWGGGAYSRTLIDAIGAAGTAGILFVAAAGNDAEDGDLHPHFPASYALPNVIAVAATDSSDALAQFSNWGASSVLLGAPGVSILSTFPGGGYRSYSGTSMATPMVVGALALLLAAEPGLSMDGLRARLAAAVDPVPALAGRTITGGRLNVFRMLATPDGVPPGAITDLAVVATGSSWARLRFTATGDDGAAGRASTYDIRYAPGALDPGRLDDAALFVSRAVPGASGSTETIEVTGLAPATAYAFAVRARDEWDTPGPAGNIASGVTLAAPVLSSSPPSFAAALRTGQATTLDLHVANAGPGTLDWSVEPGAPGWLGADPASGRLGAGEGREIALRLDASGLPGGEYGAELALLTNDPAHPRNPHPVTLTVTDAPAIALSRAALDFGVLPAGAAVTRSLELRNTGTTDLTVMSIAADDDTVAIAVRPPASNPPLVLSPGAACTADVTWTPARPGTLAATLVVSSDAANDTAARTALAGVAIAPPIVGGLPASIDVALKSGESATREFDLANLGGSDLVVEMTATSGPPEWLSVAPARATVAPGASARVTVTMDASGLEPGRHDGVVQVAGNAPGAGTMAIAVGLDVEDAPHLAIEVPEILLESRRGFDGDGAATTHRLEAPIAPVGGGTLELTAEGDFGSPLETATLVVEGQVIGATGGIEDECGTAAGRFELDAATLAGFLSDGRLEAEVRNSPAVGSICESNRHTVRLRYAPPQDRVDFGAVAQGTHRHRTVLLRNTGSADLPLASISAQGDGFGVEVDAATPPAVLAPGAALPLIVTLDAGVPGSPGSLAGELAIDGDDPDHPHVVVPLAALLRPWPVLAALPASIEATLLEGHSDTRTVRLDNPGDAPIDLGLVVRGDAGVRPPDCPAAAILAGAFNSGDLVLFDASTGAASTVATGLYGPGGMAMDAAGRRAWVLEFNGRLASVDLATGAVTYSDSGQSTSFGIAIDPGTESLLIAGYTSGALTRLDPATGMVTPVATGLQGPQAIAVDVSGRFAWITEPGSGTLARVDLRDGAVTLAAGGLDDARGLALSADGSEAYVSLSTSGTVKAVDLVTGAQCTIARGLGWPSALALDEDGVTLYAAEFAAARITAIDLRTGATRPAGAPIASPSGLALIAPGACAARFALPTTRALTIPGHATAAVDVVLDATGLAGGPRQATLAAIPEGSGDALAAVPLSLTVVARPRIRIGGQEVVVTSFQGYTTVSARTVHTLPIAVTPRTAGTLEVVAEGDYGTARETASVSLEGAVVGTVGGNGADCTAAHASFPVAAAALAAAAADGTVSVMVQNTADVAATCPINRHTVRLHYFSADPAQGIDFGRVHVGTSQTVPIVVANDGQTPLTVSSITVDDPRFEVAPSAAVIAPGASSVVTVRCAPERGGGLEGSLTLQSDDPDTPVAAVALRAIGFTDLPDADQDGVPDGTDDCPAAYDPLQQDSDGDGLGDVCDDCPSVPDPGQADSDGDGAGDACQPSVVLTRIRQDGGERLEVEAWAADPQGLPTTWSVRFEPLDPGTPALDLPETGPPPRLADIAALAPGARYRLVLSVGNGTTIPAMAAAEFQHQHETTLVLDNPPAAVIGAPAVVECDRPLAGGVALDAGASTDIDTAGGSDRIAGYAWFRVPADPGSDPVPIGEGPVVHTELPLGVNLVLLRVTDTVGETGEATATVEVRDTRPPTLSLGAAPDLLWPPDHTLREVLLDARAQDACDPDPMVVVVMAVSSEADDAAGDGDGSTTGDVDAAPGTACGTVRLRAERSAGGPGRLYTIVCEARDRSGWAARAATAVVVPHDAQPGPGH
jgi:subtilisin family serine protease/sugar lactone lactonase YvrE